MKIIIIIIIIIIAIAIGIIFLFNHYPRKFETLGHFKNMIKISDEVDPWTTWSDDDIKLVNEGKQYSKTISLVLAILVRDISKEIKFIKKKITNLSRIFKRIHVIVFENDSTDTTRKIFLRWVKHSPWENVSFRCVDPVTFELNKDECKLQKRFSNSTKGIRGRILRLSYLRNQLHQYTCQFLLKNPEFEYVLNSDMDLHGNIYTQGILHTFGHFLARPDIQCIGFRGTTRNGWLWDPYAFENTTKSSSQLFKVLTCRLATKSIGFSEGLIKVDSTFSGGIFIRAREMNKDFNYNIINIIGSFAFACEHIAFNHNFKNLYINTHMVLTHGKED